eukprot:TRINITY_DN413_c0_g1_i1.p1 TRINITY_DN413_c0_g1~~TRINITY_DN413_c0_g1_i1.p1  ORF type:complete len:331 (+),score=84.60 TRINITY_DN413_c0_g1_i1:135-1127(+)
MTESDHSRYGLKVITGNANRQLADAVSKALGVPLCAADVGRFANGEIRIMVKDNIRGDDVFILQPTCLSEHVDSVNTSLMELLLLIHTCKLASARRVTAVVPHFAYARQDRKTEARVPISASAVAQLVMTMGADRVVTVDLHCGQIQGFFHNVPVDNLYALPAFCSHFEASFPHTDRSKLAIVSPDAGGVARARMVADKLRAAQVVTILKRRVEAGKVDSMQIVGDVTGFDCWIVDDMCDTCGTLVAAVRLLKASGAASVSAFATHGILTDPACQRLNDCAELDQCIVTDTIPQSRNLPRVDKLKVISVAPLLADAIRRIHDEKSLSELF